MTKQFILNFTLFFIPFLTFAQDSITQNQNTYFGLLSKEGFRPEIDSDGDIKFKYEGSTFYIETNSPENIFKIFTVLKADSIVGENGCSAEYLIALNNTSKFQDGCIFYAFNDCKSLLLKWFVDLDEDDELTSQQFYNSISRLNEGLKNIKTELREIGLMK